MLRTILSAVFALTTLAVSTGAASAEERFALVIGNSQYRSVAALPNPARDVRDVSTLLKDAGFAVTSAFDLDRAGMSRAVRDFADSVARKSEDSVVLIYYAGHGVQIDGQNYLVPIDARIEREADVALEAVRFADLMNMLDGVRSRTRIVILDACRDNPFADVAKHAGRGFAMVNAPAGSMVAYSTSPGATAADGAGSNSPFTAALIKAVREPGAPIENALKNVRLAVHQATGGQQTPWEVSSLTRPFSFFPGEGRPTKIAEEKSDEAWRRELRARSAREAFEIALREDNVIVYQQFLVLYEREPFALRIRSLLDRRLEMMAWFDAVTLDTADAFAAFLERYPSSDLAETARRLQERAAARNAMARALPGGLGLTAKARPEVRTIIKEVKVPVVKEVIKEVPVIKEVVREVKVPEIRTVIKEVRVPSPPQIRTVIKEVKVPVRVPCVCDRPGRPPAHGGPILRRPPPDFRRQQFR
jgi:hypothetical protein